MAKPRTKKSDLVSIYVSNGPLAAEVIKSKLESEGIPAMLKFESYGRVLGLTIDGMGEVQVLVRASDEERARELIGEK